MWSGVRKGPILEVLTSDFHFANHYWERLWSSHARLSGLSYRSRKFHSGGSTNNKLNHPQQQRDFITLLLGLWQIHLWMKLPCWLSDYGFIPPPSSPNEMLMCNVFIFEQSLSCWIWLLDSDCFQHCTDEGSPLCATDGNTYANACALDIAVCEARKDGKYISIVHSGPCGKYLCTKKRGLFFFALTKTLNFWFTKFHWQKYE